MDNKIIDFISNLPGAGDLSSEIESLLSQMKSETTSVFNMQAERMEKYMLQLANDEITAADLERYIKHIQTIVEMRKTKASAAIKRKGKEYAEKIGALILKKLVFLVLAL